MYFVATFLTNLLTCLRVPGHTNTANYFRVDPPTVDEYLATFEGLIPGVEWP